MTLPRIHLNGTGHWTLLKGYESALEAARAARVALGNVEFHARDYYPDGMQEWDNAVREREALFSNLDAVIDALAQHVEYIDEVITRRGTP